MDILLLGTKTINSKKGNTVHLVDFAIRKVAGDKTVYFEPLTYFTNEKTCEILADRENGKIYQDLAVFFDKKNIYLRKEK